MPSHSDTYTVSDFSNKPTEHIKRLMDSKRPEVLTLDGKAPSLYKMLKPTNV